MCSFMNATIRSYFLNDLDCPVVLTGIFGYQSSFNCLCSLWNDMYLLTVVESFVFPRLLVINFGSFSASVIIAISYFYGNLLD